MKNLIFVVLLMLVIPVSVSAYWECSSELNVSCAGMRVSCCPKGDFEHIRNGCGGSDDYIEVIVKDYWGNAVSGIPWTDYWINACLPEHELHLCVQHIVADSLTGSNGRTTFSGRMSVGGCIPEGGIWMAVQGITLRDEETCIAPICADVVIVSPDINADGFVNLSDLSMFAEAYNTQEGAAAFNTCCDYNDDGSCDLSDFAYLGQHYQHECF